MKARLKDIAAATGFSVNTVSHALRDMPDISGTTKEIIRQAARELGYIPNLQASSIKSGKSRMISIILPDIANPHFTIVFREIEEYFRKLGITPFFINTNEDPEEELNAVRLSIGQNVDGVILCPTQVHGHSIHLLQDSGIPFVLIGRHFGTEMKANYVVCDDTQGAYLATAHLLELGHRKIAYCKTNDHISSDTERFAGYQKAMAEAGETVAPELVLQLSPTGAHSGEAIRAFLEANPACTAVLAFSDILAYAVIRELLAMGRRVPEDVSVMGFDNICSDYALPIQLSSVSVSKKHMALTACEILYGQISGDSSDVPQEVVLPTRLFLRETTARNGCAKNNRVTGNT